jgi:NAD(P)-dependent dehydrogenase (short-subunit alcohol dehydrogenase family)
VHTESEEKTMLLENKTAVIYGAGGAVGGAVARAFAREGANVFLTGRTLNKVEAVAQEITASRGTADAAQLDALDEQAVEKHLEAVIHKTGGVDISFNATGISASIVADKGMQGIPLTDVSLDSFLAPITAYTGSNFVTARSAAPQMAQKGSGVILMHTPEPGRRGTPLIGGMGPAWAAMEAMCRGFSAEFAARGVRIVGLRTTGLPETKTIEIIFGLHAKVLGIPREQFQQMIEGMGHTRRSSTLSELTNAAVFLASDRAAGLTGTAVNLTGGVVND